MRLVLILALMLSCSSRDDDIEEIIDETEIEQELGPFIEINWRQWKCCIDICGGSRRNLQSVSKELKPTEYIVCECKDNRRFHLTKLQGPKAPSGKGYKGTLLKD